ncbi:hypothetical protein [Halalkalibacter okhensis]|uniref:Phage protein n=1 Tax=Halalkalibacter okhensis TaxID=333138 RepID=A0A0B0III9_9BACI|nr:hypothetical protein [Halalkalibacter okhensis]KHF40702.1 hypothetical protein LQ50_07875 [Halalkalibacter okhensis]
MSNIIDLSLLTQEPLILKFGEDDQFTIPPEPTVDFVLKIAAFEDKAMKSKSEIEYIGLFVKMVTHILNQDENRTITEDFVKKKVKITQMQQIVKAYKDKIAENAENPN